MPKNTAKKTTHKTQCLTTLEFAARENASEAKIDADGYLCQAPPSVTLCGLIQTPLSGVEAYERMASADLANSAAGDR